MWESSNINEIFSGITIREEMQETRANIQKQWVTQHKNKKIELLDSQMETIASTREVNKKTKKLVKLKKLKKLN